MKRLNFAWLIAPGLLALTYCGESPPPQRTQVIVQPAPQAQAAPTVVPTPPPPLQAETVPPPPASGTTEVWQPGHWSYTGMAGNPWVWESGRYVAPPTGQTTWVPGRWAQEPSGGWVWTDGHWA